MNDILMMSHFHKDFPFNHNSSWMRAAFAGGTGAYEYYPPSKDGVWINTSREQKRIQEYQHYYSSVSELEFLKAMGQQPSGEHSVFRRILAVSTTRGGSKAERAASPACKP